jgi:hypothetical protein
MPLRQTASRNCLPLAGSGQSMTFGFTEVRTASSTSRPARSIAAAVRQGRSRPALCAAMTAVAVLGTLPRARKCDSRSPVVTFTPACTRAIF